MPKRIYPRQEFEKLNNSNNKEYATSHNKMYGNLKPIKYKNEKNISKNTPLSYNFDNNSNLNSIERRE